MDIDQPAKGVRHIEVFMCFTEAALTGQVELTQRHLLNGQPLTIE